MSSSFRISSSLWDKIHHFASFPQTGGQLLFLWLSNHLPYHKYISVVAANGSIWSEPKSGNFVESQSIPARYAPLMPFITSPHPITLLIFCTERGAPSSTRAPRQRTR